MFFPILELMEVGIQVSFVEFIPSNSQMMTLKIL